MSVPFTRTLAYVLRDQLDDAAGVKLTIRKVSAIPNAGQVTITDGTTTTTIPRLKSYAPTVGEPVYCLVSGSTMLALGTVAAF